MTPSQALTSYQEPVGQLLAGPDGCGVHPADGAGETPPHADPAIQTPAIATPIPLAISLDATPIPTRLTDWQSEYQWVVEERSRLEAYTLAQFALIKQQREELLGRRAGIEETLALREQELNRKLRLLAEAQDTLDCRNRELAEREEDLQQNMEKLSSARTELQLLEQSCLQLQTENEAYRLLAEEHRIQTAHLEEAVRATRSELGILERGLQQRRRAAEEERAELAASRRQLDQRFTALEEGEESLRRRVTEIDQLEVQIRQELEQRERLLGIEYQELERVRLALRMDNHIPTATQPGP